MQPNLIDRTSPPDAEASGLPAPVRLPRRRGVQVSLQSLSKAYGEREVLKAVDLTIKAGEFVAVVGRSGCGKSTLLRLIAKLERADQGSIQFGQSAVRPEIRVMFQDSR